jgi:hypothetical protein
MIIIGRMTEFFYNRYGEGEVEAFSNLKEYNQVYVDQGIAAGFDEKNYVSNSAACTNPSSQTFATDCSKEYANNAATYEKLIVKNNTMNGSFGDSKDKQSEVIISNINLGIGIAIMMSYIYSFSEK